MTIDGGRTIDWGRTSCDYATHRPGPPASYFDRLRVLGVGKARQRLLDLATGTGLIARGFASRGCRVAGIDVAPEQVEMARSCANEEGLEIDLRVSPAETLPFEDACFDVATANQCWLYFDRPAVIEALRRVLAPGGLVAITHFSYLPRTSAVARASEELVLRYNRDWSGADWSGRIPMSDSWAGDGLRRQSLLVYDEAIAFSRESWRGRLRALRGIGASLPTETVEQFDAEHAALLHEIAPPEFEVLHRIDLHVFSFDE